jgi:hypothetical protein
MPSKFPGMDPYLEGSLWPDFHSSIIPLLRSAIVQQLPAGFAALVGQHVWLEESPADGARKMLGVPDVVVPETAGRTSRPTTGTAVLEAPVRSRLAAVVERPGPKFIRITDRQQRRVVTTIELLSPANKKPGKDNDQYLLKRSEYLRAATHLVELDFLRDYPRMPLGEPLPAVTEYVVLLVRAETYPQADLWPFSVRDAFPPLVVPLCDGERDIIIDLNDCFRECYDSAQYGRLIDYSQPAEPPLNEADAAWAATLPPQR